MKCNTTINSKTNFTQIIKWISKKTNSRRRLGSLKCSWTLSVQKNVGTPWMISLTARKQRRWSSMTWSMANSPFQRHPTSTRRYTHSWDSLSPRYSSCANRISSTNTKTLRSRSEICSRLQIHSYRSKPYPLSRTRNFWMSSRRSKFPMKRNWVKSKGENLNLRFVEIQIWLTRKLWK